MAVNGGSLAVQVRLTLKDLHVHVQLVLTLLILLLQSGLQLILDDVTLQVVFAFNDIILDALSFGSVAQHARYLLNLIPGMVDALFR